MKKVDIISNIVARKGEALATPSKDISKVNLSGYLLKSIWDKVWEIRTDSQGTEYIFGKLPMVTQYGLTMYSGDGVDIPSLASGLPFDGRTIWYNPETNQIEVIGGTGGGSGEGVSNFWDLSGIPSWITNSKPKYTYSEIEGTPDLSGYATQSWVENKKYLTSITSAMVTSALGFTPFNAASFTKSNIKSTLGISDWALASSKPSYTTSEVSEGSNLYFTNARAVSALAETLKAYVTLSGSQTITGEKNFTGGLKVNGSPIYYDTEKKYWKLEGDLLVTGGVTMYGSDSSFTPSTIMDAILYDSATLGINSNGQLYVKGGTSGGGLDITALQNYLTQNSYLNVTEGDNRYLKLLGGTINSTFGGLEIKRNNAYASAVKYSNTSGVLGYIGFNDNSNPTLWNKSQGELGVIIHSGNYSQYALPLSGGTISSASYGGFNISRNGDGFSAIKYSNSSDGVLGYIGVGGSGSAYAKQPTFISNEGTFIIYNSSYPISGAVIEGALSFKNSSNYVIYNEAYKYLEVFNNTGMCGIAFGDDGTNKVYNNGWKTIIHEGNIWSQSVSYASKARTLVDSSNNSVAYVSTNIFYIGDTIYPSTETHILGKQVRLRGGSNATTGLTIDSDGDTFVENRLNVKEYINVNRNGASGAIYNTSKMGLEIETYDKFATFSLYTSSGGLVATDIFNLTEAGHVLIRKAQSLDNGYALQSGGGISADGHVALTGYLYMSDNTNTLRPAIDKSDNTLLFGYGQSRANYDVQYLGYNIRLYSGGGHSTGKGIDILANGNVGIGTNNPISVLHVKGKTTISEELDIFNALYKSRLTLLNLDNISRIYNYNEEAIKYEDMYIGKNGDSAIVIKGDTFNVGINNASPSYKLDVKGTIASTSTNNSVRMITDADCGLYMTSSGQWLHLAGKGNSMFIYNGEWDNKGQGNYNKGIVITSSNYVGIGTTSPSAKLHVSGDILATGAMTFYSMRKLKNVVDERGLSLNELSTIKPTRYTWKDGRDNRLHFGGIADDIQQVLPEVVYSTSDGILTMDYGNAAFAVASSLIKPVVDHENRIAMLEEENKELRNEIERLKSA